MGNLDEYEIKRPVLSQDIQGPFIDKDLEYKGTANDDMVTLLRIEKLENLARKTIDRIIMWKSISISLVLLLLFTAVLSGFIINDLSSKINDQESEHLEIVKDAYLLGVEEGIIVRGQHPDINIDDIMIEFENAAKQLKLD